MGDTLPYVVEYAPSGKARCQQCSELIGNDQPRIGERKQSYFHDGPRVHWFHLACFAIRPLCNINVKPKSIADFDKHDNIRWEDQEKLKTIIERMNPDNNGNWRKTFRSDDMDVDSHDGSSEPPLKKMKTDSEDPTEIAIKEQTQRFFHMRDDLKSLKRKSVRLLLWHNGQKIPRSTNAQLDAAADAMFFGALKPCKKEKCSGKLEYVSGLGYKCTGDIGKWAKCDEVTEDPERTQFAVVPSLLKESLFLQIYKSKVRKRIFRKTLPSTLTSNENMDPNENIQFPKPIEIDVGKWGMQKLRVTRSGVVDPQSYLDKVAHVYQLGADTYSVTLAKACFQRKKNSHYRIQILKHNEQNVYWLFRNWGRIGTNIGDTMLNQLPLEQCVMKFEKLFFEKTGNNWKDRQNFEKKANKMYPIDTDHGEEECRKEEGESKLEPSIQNLIEEISDPETMKRVMREYHLDLERMPLGNLSKDQLLAAYKVLTTVFKEMERKPLENSSLIEATNRFYTLVPHSYGLANPPLFTTQEDVLQKCDMLSDLLDIAISYNLFNLDINAIERKHYLDANYEKLKTEITVLDKNTEMYDVINKYVTASSHKNYDLETNEVFVIKREGEEERYAPFSNMPNRKLLWHGSRTCNYPSILSQGLRMPLPEVPVSGLMFGRGIYFADTVIKSANYCKCDDKSDNPTGLLLLCEVALGDMYGCKRAEKIEVLPEGKNSAIGHGRTRPDPAKVYRTEDGVLVPYGPGIPTDIQGRLALRYNEYIVYNPAQVKVKYLVKVNFLVHNVD